MKKLWLFVGVLLLGIAMAPWGTDAATGEGAEAFEKLKALAGHWESAKPGPTKATVDIQVTSGGSVVMEQVHIEDKSGPVTMVTMYYLDGGQLKLTHYCAAGNQPTLRGTYYPDTNTITFDFVSASNLKSPADGHMHHAVYKLIDNNHVKMTWVYQKELKDAFTEEFEYVRTK